MSPQLLPLAAIDLVDRTWPRTGLNEDRVQEFARRYADDGPYALDPVLVVPQQSGRFLLVNGRHRLAARRIIGANDVVAAQADTGGRDPVQFAFDFALADSARSALPLTRAEKHAAVVRLVRDHPDRTDVSIAGLVGVSTKTVQRARTWLVEHPDGQSPSTSRRELGGQPPTAQLVANNLVRGLDRLWDARGLGMVIGVRDSSRLGDHLAEAFIDRVGAEQAAVWTERLQTWAARAHAITTAAAREEAS